jgi:AcrR family transcriptional regulator
MVDHVLAIAADLVVEVGFEAVVGSPTLLLDRSGVSRGSFYAFFESPTSVLDELAYQRILLSVDDLERAFKNRRGRRWIGIVDTLVEYYVEEHRVPLIRELWVRQNLTQRARELDQLAIDDIAELLMVQFQRHAPLFAELTQLQCAVAIHSLERLCQFAFIDDPEGNPAVIREARGVLASYFASHSGE